MTSRKHSPALYHPMQSMLFQKQSFNLQFKVAGASLLVKTVCKCEAESK